MVVTDRTPVQQSGSSVRRSATGHVDTNTWPIWVIAVLPLLNAVVYLLTPAKNSVTLGNSVTVLLTILTIAVTIAVVILAVLDRRALAYRGVERPLHWGYALVQPVYVIARSVVVRRRVHGSLLPLGIWVTTTVIAAICGLQN